MCSERFCLKPDEPHAASGKDHDKEMYLLSATVRTAQGGLTEVDLCLLAEWQLDDFLELTVGYRKLRKVVILAHPHHEVEYRSGRNIWEVKVILLEPIMHLGGTCFLVLFEAFHHKGFIRCKQSMSFRFAHEEPFKVLRSHLQILFDSPKINFELFGYPTNGESFLIS